MKGRLEERLGADRVIEPPGSLPQPAARLDPSGPVRPTEIEVDVELLCLDSTSFREIAEDAGSDPDRMAARIGSIVADRGKLHNPETDSGGVLYGKVAAVGEARSDPPAVGEPIVSLSSLTTIPLRLETVGRPAPPSAQVEVGGTAYLADRVSWTSPPEDLPLATAIDVLDVCAAASQVRALASPGVHVLVLGAGHAGKLAMAAARDSAPGGTVVAVDVDATELDGVRRSGLCDIAVAADLRDPLAAVAALREAGAPAADLTVVVVNAAGCEPAALLLTREGGTALFFSMATRFSAAALAADGTGSDVRMLIGSGFSPDGGAYALGLVRERPELGEALGVTAREPAA